MNYGYNDECMYLLCVVHYFIARSDRRVNQVNYFTLFKKLRFIISPYDGRTIIDEK